MPRASGWACGSVLLLASNISLTDGASDDGWHFLVAPYLWVANLDGTRREQ
jgi:hypothetical protein